MREIEIQELQKMPKEDYVLIDIRDEGSTHYGTIPGALKIPHQELLENPEEKLEFYDEKRLVVLYCQRGQISIDIAEQLHEETGRECASLRGGYNAYLMECIAVEEDDESQKKAEESIRKKFHKKIFSPFAKACKTYQLIQEGDHIAVCISGGKDSMLMAKLFQEIKRHRQVNFDLTFLVMDPGYNKANRALIESNAKRLGIPVTIFESDIFDAVDTVEKNPCYLCARRCGKRFR